MPSYLVPIQMNKNAIKGVVIDPLASAPSSPVEGQIYWDTALQQLQVRGTSTWGLTANNSLNLNGQNAAYYLARATDGDATGEITPGAFWYVEEGTTYGKTQWRLENTGTVTLGTTALTINQFGGAAAYTNGNGLSLTGNTFAVVADTGISVSGLGVAADFTVLPKKYSATIGNGSSTSIAVTHSIGTKDVVVSVRATADDSMVIVDWVATSTTVVTFTFASAPASNAYRVTIMG
jgi:hypothetical protein